MILARRLLLLGALVVSLWSVGQAATPFGAGCGPAAFESFKGRSAPTTVPVSVDIFRGITNYNECKRPARSRLQTSATVLVLAGVGVVSGLRILREPSKRAE